MIASKFGRVGAVALCLVAVKLAAGCSLNDEPEATGGGGQGAGGTGAGVAGAQASSGASALAGSAATAGTSAGGSVAAGGAATAGGAGGGAGAGGAAAGAGGAAGGASGGGGGTGGSAVANFAPCSAAPADTVPALKRGPAITGFQGMQTAGQMIGVPGEAGTLYVIGHRNGAVYTVQDGKVAGTLVSVSVANGGNNEQGLLSMAIHPAFASNHLFYLFYTASDGGAMTVDEFERLTPTTAMLKRNVYSHERAGGGMFHNGGQLAFNPKDEKPYLYLSVGNNESNTAGDPAGFAGRVLRFDLDSKAQTSFAWGLRNPYRMSVDRLTGDMYIADVANGPGGTIIFNAAGKSGTDYGYRNNNGNPDVNEGILRDSNGAAIIGGFVYRGNKIPGLCGRYFYGNYQGGVVKSIVVKDGEKVGDTVTHGSLSVPGDITSFGEDGEGELYMASMNNTIYKIIAQ
jgi:glucose/arabinose dehydrogenase